MKLLSSVVLASAITAAAAKSTVICVTKSGTSSVKPVPTTSTTIHTTKTKTVVTTTHPTVTVTASGKICLLEISSPSANQSTGTTTTITDTTTSDTTTTLSTSTVCFMVVAISYDQADFLSGCDQYNSF